MDQLLSSRHNSMSEAFLSLLEYIDQHRLKQRAPYTVTVKKYPMGEQTLHIYTPRFQVKTELDAVFVLFSPLTGDIEATQYSAKDLEQLKEVIFASGDGINLAHIEKYLNPHALWQRPVPFMEAACLAGDVLAKLHQTIDQHYCDSSIAEPVETIQPQPLIEQHLMSKEVM